MSEVTGLLSCEPTVWDRERPVLACRGVPKVFCGDSASGGGAGTVERPLTGDDATVVAAFCKLGGTFGTSRADVSCNVDPAWCDRLEELLALRRASAPCPATNETSSGEEGWETRLGDELV